MTKPSSEQKQAPVVVIVFIIAIILASVGYFYFSSQKSESVTPIIEPTVIVEPQPEVVEAVEELSPEVEEVVDVVEEEVIEPAPEPEVILPMLDESDHWFSGKLADLTWRKELIKLMITDDMIRRFVVFTDNFSQGTLAYEHAPVISPTSKFSAIEIKDGAEPRWQWDEGATRRFSLYVDLLRSLDSDILIQWYVELKPLIDQAYQELGYPDDDFTDVLHQAISKVLDMEIPKDTPELERPSVMYRYKDQSLESLDDAEKLLLRLGKDNLLVIKSVMLEINEKLARTQS